MEYLKSIDSPQIRLKNRWFIALFVSNRTAWKLNQKTAQATNVVTWLDLRTSHGWLVWKFLVLGLGSRWYHSLSKNVFHIFCQASMDTLFNCITEFSSLIQWRINVERDLKNSVSSIFKNFLCFYRTTVCIQSLWQYLRKKTGKAWNKKYESPLKTPFYCSVHLFEGHRSEWVLSNNTNGSSGSC